MIHSVKLCGVCVQIWVLQGEGSNHRLHFHTLIVDTRSADCPVFGLFIKVVLFGCESTRMLITTLELAPFFGGLLMVTFVE